MIEGLNEDDLDGWRSHPVTRAVMREVDKRQKQRDGELKNASVDGSLDRVRRVSGMLEEIEWLQRLMKTTGEEK